ncbi:MAG: ATP-binding protein [Bacteroidia bacterium]
MEKLKLEVRSVNNKYVVDIRDSGVGIAKENIPYIFDRFKKFKKTTESSYGLGLAIVKTISDYHRINITVESEEHKGTIFSIEFPDEYHS